jgi:predicted enzyme related to lactoylglutathione lyase
MVVAPEDPDGTELVLKPNAEHPAMQVPREALWKDGISFTAFEVFDVHKEYARLKSLDVEFTMEPTNIGMTTIAILNDTCGNLIQIYQMTVE